MTYVITENQVKNNLIFLPAFSIYTSYIRLNKSGKFYPIIVPAVASTQLKHKTKAWVTDDETILEIYTIVKINVPDGEPNFVALCHKHVVKKL